MNGSGERPELAPPRDPAAGSTDSWIDSLKGRHYPKVYILSGPSGVGKDTVVDQLRERFADLHVVVTATTREKREGEVDGLHYHFLDKETFQEWLRQDELFESAIVYGNYYGVPKIHTREALRNGQDVIIKVDVQGAQTLRLLVPEAVSIFLAPGSAQDLLDRLHARNLDDPESVMRRFHEAEQELRRAGEFDYIVFNETNGLDQAIADVTAIIRAERLRSHQVETRV